jgi:hypothetical protein
MARLRLVPDCFVGPGLLGLLRARLPFVAHAGWDPCKYTRQRTVAALTLLASKSAMMGIDPCKYNHPRILTALTFLTSMSTMMRAGILTIRKTLLVYLTGFEHRNQHTYRS